MKKQTKSVKAGKIQNYKEKRLPSNKGVVVEPLRGRLKSFIPREALANSVRLRNVKVSKRCTDPYSEERVSKGMRAVDSSEETMGG